MNNEENKVFLLKAILRKANKTRVCPICDIPYVDAKHVLAHCRKKAEENPEDIQHKCIGCVNTGRDFKSFSKSLCEAVGWPDMPESELPLIRGGTGPPAYGDCLKISWIVEKKSRLVPSRKMSLLHRIVLKAKIHHVCPLCLLGFSTGQGVLQHCGEVNDIKHRGLGSNNQTTFLEFYEKAMGQSLSHGEVRVTYDRAGNPQYEDCFRIEEILKHKCKGSIYYTAIHTC